MNEDIYKALVVYKPDLEGWCAKQDNVLPAKCRAIGHIRDMIFPNMKPVNYSCYSCVNEMMHLMFNVLRSYEDTIRK